MLDPRSFLLLLATFVPMVCLAGNELITHADIQAAEQNVGNPWFIWKNVDLGHGHRCKFEFSFTNKGNGALSLGANQWVQTFDAHDDGDSFQDWVLSATCQDIDSDGYLDLVVYGIQEIRRDDGDTILERKPVTGVFRYSPDQKAFACTYRTPNLRLFTDETTAGTQIRVALDDENGQR